MRRELKKEKIKDEKSIYKKGIRKCDFFLIKVIKKK